jgi:hypothetical protein
MGRIRITGTLIDFFKTTATGIISMVLPDAGAPPTEAGELLRHGADIKWHDGTAARTIVATDATQTLANKTLSATARVGFADQGADPTVAGELLRNGVHLKWHDGTTVRRLNGSLVSVQMFTSSGTWTRPSGVSVVVVEVIGGGGGGGGAGATGAGQTSAGSGGGSGGYAVKRIDVSGISSATITVGAGGTGGAAGATGGNGGASSWVDGTNTITANGGTGGAGAGPSSATGIANTAGIGGTATGGDINVPGQGGFPGIHSPGFGVGTGGFGGSNPYGAGGRAIATATNTNGQPGQGFGSGGSGAANAASQPGQSGSPGAGGLVVVWEYT